MLLWSNRSFNLILESSDISLTHHTPAKVSANLDLNIKALLISDVLLSGWFDMNLKTCGFNTFTLYEVVSFNVELCTAVTAAVIPANMRSGLPLQDLISKLYYMWLVFNTHLWISYSEHLCSFDFTDKRSIFCVSLFTTFSSLNQIISSFSFLVAINASVGLFHFWSWQLLLLSRYIFILSSTMPCCVLMWHFISKKKNKTKAILDNEVSK